MEAKVRLDEVDEESLFRTQDIKVSSSKSFKTPIKAIDLGRIKQKYPINSSGKGLNEIFRRFSEEDIKNYNEDTLYSDKLKAFFNYQRNKIDTDSQVTATFLEFSENRMPTDEEIEFLVSTAYPNSDVVTIPIVAYINKIGKIKDKAIRDKIVENYEEYLKKVIAEIEELNNKPIMGFIPEIAPKKIADIIKIYQDNGIRLFAVDLNGSNPISSCMRIFKVLKTLKKEKILDESFIHGFNIGNRVNKTDDILPARDILGFGLGLNSIGDKHKRQIVTKYFLEFLESMKNSPKTTFRLFNKADYGYWKAITLQKLKEEYPKDTKINIEHFSDEKTDKSELQRLFNIEQLSIEAKNIREVIAEEPAKSMKYLKGKKEVLPDDISNIENIGKKLNKKDNKTEENT